MATIPNALSRDRRWVASQIGRYFLLCCIQFHSLRMNGSCALAMCSVAEGKYLSSEFVEGFDTFSVSNRIESPQIFDSLLNYFSEVLQEENCRDSALHLFRASSLSEESAIAITKTMSAGFGTSVPRV